MKIKTLYRIFDDNDVECREGDMVLVQTRDMDEPTPAVIREVMTNMATFVIDDRMLGHVPVRARCPDIVSLTLHKRKT